MTHRLLSLALVAGLCLLAFLFWFLAISPNSGTPDLTADLDVYSALLAYTNDTSRDRRFQPSADILSPWRDNVRFLIHPSSSLPPLSNFTSPDCFTRLRRALPSIRLSTWRHFLQRNRQAAGIPRALSSAIPFRFEALRPDDAFDGPDSVLRRYPYPGYRAIFVFSRVGYSGEQALVHLSRSFDVAAFGSLIQLQRGREGWRVIGSVSADCCRAAP